MKFVWNWAWVIVPARNRSRFCRKSFAPTKTVNSAFGSAAPAEPDPLEIPDFLKRKAGDAS